MSNPKYIVTGLYAYAPKELIGYRESFDEKGDPVHKPYIKSKEWRVEITFQSSGDVSTLTADHLGGHLFKLLMDNPIP